jgi:hypothetical protein
MAAVAFLHDNAALLLDLARAADLYRKETNLLASAFANRDAFTNSADNWTAEMRQRERDILTRARAIEEEAISFLEKALAVL